MLLKQIFVENGVPIGMHIHPSIANVNARTALSQRIMVRKSTMVVEICFFMVLCCTGATRCYANVMVFDRLFSSSYCVKGKLIGTLACAQHSGGDPTASAQSARVILADPNTEVFQHLVKIYQGVSDKYIESYLWVKKCIDKGQLVYTPLVYKNPGGRRPGEE